MQILVLGIVRGTRFTGTVTVSVTPQTASRSPLVMTSGPDSAFSVTFGPEFAESEMRIADVPRGIVPLIWHPLLPPLAEAIAWWAGIEFVPATVSREPESTTPSAVATSASPIASATRTLSTVRVAD